MSREIYYPNPYTNEQLRKTYLISLIGPYSIGKDSIMDVVAKMYPNYKKVISHTNRKPRKGEQDGVDYHFVRNSRRVKKEMSKTKDKSEFVQYAEHPTLDVSYWTTLHDWNLEGYSMLATLPLAYEDMSKHFFVGRSAIMVVCDSEEYSIRTKKRDDKMSGKERQKRRAEALSSLQWGLERDDVVWLHNKHDDLKRSGQLVVGIVNQEADIAISEEAREVGHILLNDLLADIA